MEFLEIGEIVKAHGLKGRVKVLSFLHSYDLLNSLKEVFIERGKDAPASFRLKSVQIKGNCFYLEMEGIENIEQAECLVGCPVLIPADNLAVLPEGEYYWRELIGLAVVTEAGRRLGKVERIFPTGSNDVLVCGEGDEEIFLPAIEEVIRKVDLEGKMVIVRLLEGL